MVFRPGAGLAVALARTSLRALHLPSMSKSPSAPVAYLGPDGTFSHLVAMRRYPGRGGHPCATISEVFHSVAAGEAAVGIVPIENSSGGTITETVDLLIEQCGRLVITEELALDVRLALLGTEGTPLGRIRAVHSHVMPLRHHRDWIRENLPAASLSECSSTAEAARKAARTPSAAALAAPGAAALYGLSVLRFPVRPEAVNVTHFFVVAPAGHPASRSPRRKTAIVAALPQTPGSLHRFLGPFARAGVNLRRIVSRPVPGSPETYVFYLEVEGDSDAEPVAGALKGARRQAVRLELLGSYPTRPRYRGTR